MKPLNSYGSNSAIKRLKDLFLKTHQKIKEYEPSKEEIEMAQEYNIYACERHLGGYLIRNEKFPNGDPATWFPSLWEWAYNELHVRSVLDIGCGEGNAAKYFVSAQFIFPVKSKGKFPIKRVGLPTV